MTMLPTAEAAHVPLSIPSHAHLPFRLKRYEADWSGLGYRLVTATHTASAAGLGGDFVALFTERRDHPTLVIGDVCGHRAELDPAARRLQESLRVAANRRRRPAAILNEVAHSMSGTDDSRVMATAAVCRLSLRRHRVEATVALAGHPQALLVRGSGSTATVGTLGTCFCEDLDPDCHDHRFVLEAGDSVALYTDGITEARSPRGDQFGVDRLTAALRRPSATAEGRVVHALDDLVRFAPELEDATLAVLTVAADPPDGHRSTVPSVTPDDVPAGRPGDRRLSAAIAA